MMCMSWDWCVWRCGDVYELGLVCVFGDVVCMSWDWYVSMEMWLM